MSKIFLSVIDITGKQYLTEIKENESVFVNDIEITLSDYAIKDLQYEIENSKTLRVGNRIFRTDHIVEISVVEYA